MVSGERLHGGGDGRQAVTRDYLEAVRRLGIDPAGCVAIEVSSNGLRSAAGAALRVVAVPNVEFPPAEDVLALAPAVVDSLDDITPQRLAALP